MIFHWSFNKIFFFCFGGHGVCVISYVIISTPNMAPMCGNCAMCTGQFTFMVKPLRKTLDKLGFLEQLDKLTFNAFSQTVFYNDDGTMQQQNARVIAIIDQSDNLRNQDDLFAAVQCEIITALKTATIDPSYFYNNNLTVSTTRDGDTNRVYAIITKPVNGTTTKHVYPDANAAYKKSLALAIETIVRNVGRRNNHDEMRAIYEAHKQSVAAKKNQKKKKEKNTFDHMNDIFSCRFEQ